MSTPWIGLDDFSSVHDSAGLNGNHPEDRDSWLPLNLNSLPEKPPVEPTLGGVGLVYPGKRHVFSGPQESAKTLAAYAIGLEVVRSPARIVVIDFEMGAYDARNRLRELGATHTDLEGVLYLEPHEPATPDRIAVLVALGPALVIVDAAAGAYDLQGLDDNKRQDVERLSALYVRAFWRRGIATLMLDHVVKNLETRGKYAIGSERKVGGADVHLGFEVVTPISRGTTGHYKIVTHKDRGGFLQRGKLADLELQSDPETHQITWAFKPAETPMDELGFLPTHLMEKVSRYLELCGDEPATQNQIEANVKGRSTFVRQAAEALARHGHVNVSKGPRDANLYKSIAPYREGDHLDDCVPLRPDCVRDAVISLRPTASPSQEGAGRSDPDADAVTASHRDAVDDDFVAKPDDGIPW